MLICFLPQMPSFTHMSSDELARLARLQKDGNSPSQVADLMGRSLPAVYRQFQRNKDKNTKVVHVGRPKALTQSQADRLLKTANSMISAADSQYQVTAEMLKKATGLKCCLKTLRKTLHDKGVRFHPMREKPVRTAEDERDRLAFANKHHAKQPEFWCKSVHGYLDNKSFPVYLTNTGRSYAAKRAARGTYRAKGQGLAKGRALNSLPRSVGGLPGRRRLFSLLFAPPRVSIHAFPAIRTDRI